MPCASSASRWIRCSSRNPPRPAGGLRPRLFSMASIRGTAGLDRCRTVSSSCATMIWALRRRRPVHYRPARSHSFDFMMRLSESVKCVATWDLVFVRRRVPQVCPASCGLRLALLCSFSASMRRSSSASELASPPAPPSPDWIFASRFCLSPAQSGSSSPRLSLRKSHPPGHPPPRRPPACERPRLSIPLAFLHALIAHRLMFRRVRFDLRAIQRDVPSLTPDARCTAADLMCGV